MNAPSPNGLGTAHDPDVSIQSPQTVPAIATVGLGKSYGDKRAVDGVSFTVRRGEIFALLGPNGAGKTTTIEILEGYRKRDAGQITVLGVDPEKAGRRLKARIGIVLQATALEQELTVRETMKGYGQLYPTTVPIDTLLEQVDLADAARTRVKHLSGGQKRRLELALGLIGDPELVFLDEPTSALDPAARRTIWALIDSLREQGKTILMSSHNMEEVHALADRIGIIVEGRMRALGTAADLMSNFGAYTHIRFRLVNGTRAEDLPAQFRAAAEVDGPGLVVHSEDTTRQLAHMIAWSADHGIPLTDLTVSHPSLEEIYLSLAHPEATEIAP